MDQVPGSWLSFRRSFQTGNPLSLRRPQPAPHPLVILKRLIFYTARRPKGFRVFLLPRGIKPRASSGFYRRPEFISLRLHCWILHNPDYDPHALALEICRRKGWNLAAVHFYTKIPDQKRSPLLYSAWLSKLNRMNAKGVSICTRPLRYDTNGKAREKGIDVRIALDFTRLGRLNYFDVGLIFSQDQDLREAVHELRDIANEQGRKIKVASAYVSHPGSKYATRSIYDTDWIKIDQQLYDVTRETVPFSSNS